MNCPHCENPLTLRREDTSSNSTTGDQYARTVFECLSCGTWLTLEIPAASAQQP